MTRLEKELVPQVKKGKKVILTQVARATHTSSPRNTIMREKINKEYVSMAQRLNSKHKRGKVDTISWSIMSENHNDGTVKAIGEQATIEYIKKIDEKLGSGKIRATYLDTKLTAYQYSQVTSTYPLGCYKCTMMEHPKESCTTDFSRKRHASSELDEQAKKLPTTNGNNVD